MTILIVSAVLILLILLAFFFVIPVIKGALFWPSFKENIEKMIVLAEIKKGEKIIDLGSGDGRIVIAAAKIGAQAYGYEINPILVWLSRFKIKRANLSKSAVIYQKSFWLENFSSYDVVFVYGMAHIMKKLEEKISKELKPGARVVSFNYAFPNFPVFKKEGKIYLYKI
jgi:precorrin-6B methylase 2